LFVSRPTRIAVGLNAALGAVALLLAMFTPATAGWSLVGVGGVLFFGALSTYIVDPAVPAVTGPMRFHMRSTDDITRFRGERGATHFSESVFLAACAAPLVVLGVVVVLVMGGRQ